MDKRRVRIVEDSRDIVTYLRIFLERNGFEVEATVNGFDDCFDPATWEHIDAAIVDIILGSEVDGRDVLAWLKGNAPHIKRVVLSAVTIVAPEVEELAHVTLTKPVDPASLLHVLRTGCSNGGLVHG